MRKLLLSGILSYMCFSFSLIAQTEGNSETEVIFPDKFVVTQPLRSIPPAIIDESDANRPKPEMKDRALRVPFSAKTNQDAEPKGEDPATQKTMGFKSTIPILATFNGQVGDGTPPDPTGAAGPNHYVQAVNSYYKVYNKTGTTAAGPFTLGSLLFGSNNGDPIVMYDKFADRYVITEFGSTSDKKIYIGVSKTNDPTGEYYTYQYTATTFPDYLKFSIWTDGYYMTANFNTSEKIYVFERDQMIAGAASPRMLSTSYNPPNGGYFFCPLSGFADGQLPPAGTPCPIFSFEDDGWGSAYDDAINIYNATTDWNAGTISVAFKQSLIANAFDASYDAGWNDIPQPGSSYKLDGIGGVFTFRAQHRVWTGYNSVVLNMGVKVDSTQRSIRWFELRQDQGTGDWSIYQQSTYAPDGESRWCGSIAMDDNGGIGMGYAKSGTTTYPSICFTARNGYDPINQMTYQETVAAAGSGTQYFNRFGDYSHTSLDPTDGSIFWHTGEYFSSGNQRTKIFSFRIPYYESLDEFAGSEVNAYTDGGNIIVSGSSLPNDEKLVVDLFDIKGIQLSAKKVITASGTFNTEFAAQGLTPGVYLIRVGKANTPFQRVIKVSIQ